jgi:hypothetical protein
LLNALPNKKIEKKEKDKARTARAESKGHEVESLWRVEVDRQTSKRPPCRATYRVARNANLAAKSTLLAVAALTVVPVKSQNGIFWKKF